MTMSNGHLATAYFTLCIGLRGEKRWLLIFTTPHGITWAETNCSFGLFRHAFARLWDVMDGAYQIWDCLMSEMLTGAIRSL